MSEIRNDTSRRPRSLAAQIERVQALAVESTSEPDTPTHGYCTNEFGAGTNEPGGPAPHLDRQGRRRLFDHARCTA